MCVGSDAELGLVKISLTRIENVRTFLGRAKLWMDKYLLLNLLIHSSH